MQRFSFPLNSLTVALLCVCIAFTAMPTAALGQKNKAPIESTPPPLLDDFKFEKVDLELLKQVDLLDRRFERDGMVFEDAATSDYLSRIGHTLIPKNLVLENVTWKFRALRDPEPNSFALPNGSVYITTGLLSLLDNESQLAAVLAHEMTHVMLRHQYAQNRSNRKKYLTINVIEAVGAFSPGGITGAVISIAATIAPFIVMATISGYSRDLEREADHRAIDMMISAEYPPEEEIGMLKLLSKDIEGEQISLFYNNRPAIAERINYLTSYLGARADKITPQMELNREKTRYFKQMEPVMQHNVELAINASRFRSAVYFADRLVEFNPDSSENAFLAGEAYRTLGPRNAELSSESLSNGDKKSLAKKRLKQTLQEEEKALLATPAGQQNWKTHQEKAESSYLKALALAEPVPQAHRGLGMLYEKLGRNGEALEQYEKYLELVPAAFDRDRIQKRIDTLRST